MNAPAAGFDVAALVRELGRGARSARALPRVQARELFAAMLDGRIEDLHFGALLIAYRIKGEDAGELAGMLEAAQAGLDPLPPPGAAATPVVIASYNGARRLPNLVPLLALSLAARDIPVLVHGEPEDGYGRVATASVLAALGVHPCTSIAQAARVLAEGRDAGGSWPGQRLAFVPIGVLSPPLARLLELRRRMGLRNSAHTVVKLLDPFQAPALRLINYTHPPYRDAMAELFLRHAVPTSPGVLLARGCEGEAAADPRRQVAIERFADGDAALVAEAGRDPADPGAPLPAIDAPSTAHWTREVLAGNAAAPASLRRQLDLVAALCAPPPAAARSRRPQAPTPETRP
ncbi:DNA-binding protein YbiB [Luteimonas sp. SJ-92]|uniref:DNA-binding protein YbiB n=1 Tax=Luteimonas salinisoli TaxID=2752307 RepID=A0A853JCA4_9GAMM|nr:DNA-binding protein YbiB [Luteimonas salinisoli]NZA26269.1 DNA-binding protein YbiB [Luteimonas salinisoli]